MSYCFIMNAEPLLQDTPQWSRVPYHHHHHHHFEAPLSSSSSPLLPPQHSPNTQKASRHPIRGHDWSCCQAFHRVPASPPHSNLTGLEHYWASVIETPIPRWATPEGRGCQTSRNYWLPGCWLLMTSPTHETHWSRITPSDHRSNELLNYGTLLLL